MITSEVRVTREAGVVYGNRSRGTQRGSGYCEDHFDRQLLVREWRLWGFKVWTEVLDWEDVPLWASLEQGAFGSTEWKSKFSPKYI